MLRALRNLSASGRISDGQTREFELSAREARFGGPLCVLDPEGRARTGIPALDRRALYQLSYLGVVREMIRVPAG